MNHFLDPFTKHARDRSTARNIPGGVVDVVLRYGASVSARDGARKYAFSRESMRAIRKEFGREIAKAFETYRDVYVVEVNGKIITVAHARRALFH